MVDTTPLGNLVSLTSGQSPSVFKFSNRGYPYFKVQQLGASRKYLSRRETSYYSENMPVVPPGSVLIPKRGAAIALDRIRILKEFGFMDTNIMSIQPGEYVDGEYLYYWLSQEGLWKIADTTSIPQINNKHINPLAFPKISVPEQRKVGFALGKVDKYIDTVNRQISKRVDIKQGLMQELLTGKTRLPGFFGPWITKSISELTYCKAGGTPSTKIPEFWGGEIPWMSSGEIHQKNIDQVLGRITRKGLENSSAHIFPVGTVLIALAGQGKTRGTVAITEMETATNQSIAGIIPSNDFIPKYMFHNLNNRYDELRNLSTGDGGRGGLNLKIIGTIPVPLPTLEEQQAIADVLDAADDEIRSLEAQLEKAKLIKQGMMHELLTGKTRLV